LKTGNRAASEGYETGSETEGESEAEGEAGTSRVELPADYVGRGNKCVFFAFPPRLSPPYRATGSSTDGCGVSYRKGSHRAVRLIEMGPRIEMRLVKVVEGIVGSLRGEGETVFHEFGTPSLALALSLPSPLSCLFFFFFLSCLSIPAPFLDDLS
jgi:ribosome biogenesis protein SSF1/2